MVWTRTTRSVERPAADPSDSNNAAACRLASCKYTRPRNFIQLCAKCPCTSWNAEMLEPSAWLVSSAHQDTEATRAQVNQPTIVPRWLVQTTAKLHPPLLPIRRHYGSEPLNMSQPSNSSLENCMTRGFKGSRLFDQQPLTITWPVR